LNYLYLILSIVLLSSCAVKKDTLNVKKSDEITGNIRVVESITELDTISQDVSRYTKDIEEKLFSQKIYEKKYFRIWNIDKSKISLSTAMWADRAYRHGDTYGENLQLLKASFFDKVLDNSNYKNYLTLNKKALTIKSLNIRAIPTDKPVLRDPSKAGEGFPFDYLQNSTISANKPILISHYSKDREWVFIESSFAFGWVKSSGVVKIENKYTKLWQQAEQVFITKENIPIYSMNNDFLFKSKIGMMFALIDEDSDSYSILTVSRYKNMKPLYLKSKVKKSIAHKNRLAFNSENINKIITEVSKTNYGWGGMYSQRDCSSTLRDFYAPFGLWLPRNSSQQAKIGKVISIDGLSDSKKIDIILKNAKPFRTLLYKKGHIGLFVSNKNKKIIMYQNVWGVKTQKNGVEGRFIIGKPIFSTLEVGSNLSDYDKDASMLHKLKSISTL